MEEDGGIFWRRGCHWARRMANKAWSKSSVPNWSYGFDVILNGNTSSDGATHLQEVAFLFNNTRELGYARSPFANLTSTEVTFGDLAVEMSRSWVSFITELDTNQYGVQGAAN